MIDREVRMSKARDLETLRNEHAKIAIAIAQAYARPHPDLDAISLLKKRKLVLKDEIARLDQSPDD